VGSFLLSGGTVEEILPGIAGGGGEIFKLGSAMAEAGELEVEGQ
jgi:hypothetical protein